MIVQATPNRAVEFALLGLLALLWGSSYLWLKVAVVEIPPITLIAIRVSVAAIFLMAVIGVRGERLPRDRSAWGRLLVQAFLNSIAAWTLLAWGQQFIDAGLAAGLNSTAPIFVFFGALMLCRAAEGGALRLAGAYLGIFGVGMIVGVEAIFGLGTALAGQAAVLASAILHAGAALYGARFTGIPPAVTAAGTMLWASVVLVPIALVVDAPWRLAPSWQAISAALILGVASTGLALLLYFRLIQTLGSMGVASQAYLRAGVGVLLGVVLLGEAITPGVAIGLTATLIGVAMINTRRKRP